MTPADVVLLAIAGLAGGALNTMAAGGGVITFLACLVSGMPPQIAIATSQVAIPASFLGAVVPTWRQRRRYKPLIPAIAAAAVGTAIGVWLVSRLDAHTFRTIAPGLLLVAGALLVVQPYVPRILARRRDRNRDLSIVAVGAAGGVKLQPAPEAQPGEPEGGLGSRRRRAVMVAALFLTAVYGGGFGGGVGVAVLVVFATLTAWPWATSNASKNAICLVMSFVCSAAFLLTGLAVLSAVAVLVGSQLAGGVLGVWLAKRLSEDTLRRVVAVATAIGAVVMVGNA